MRDGSVYSKAQLAVIASYEESLKALEATYVADQKRIEEEQARGCIGQGKCGWCNRRTMDAYEGENRVFYLCPSCHSDPQIMALTPRAVCPCVVCVKREGMNHAY
jgi:hypothetical protein